MQQIGVCPGRGQAGAERIFKHVAGTAGVLADDDLRLMLPSVVPAEIASDAEGVIDGQVFVGFTAKTIRSEILSHFVYLLLL